MRVSVFEKNEFRGAESWMVAFAPNCKSDPPHMASTILTFFNEISIYWTSQWLSSVLLSSSIDHHHICSSSAWWRTETTVYNAAAIRVPPSTGMTAPVTKAPNPNIDNVTTPHQYYKRIKWGRCLSHRRWIPGICIQQRCPPACRCALVGCVPQLLHQSFAESVPSFCSGETERKTQRRPSY